MSKLKINLDDMADEVMHDDAEDEAGLDLDNSAYFVSVAQQKEGEERFATYSDKVGSMQNHPVLVAAHAIMTTLNRHESSCRRLKIEELRLLKNIADALKPAVHTVAQDGESIIAVSGSIATKCACRIAPIGTGLAHDRLQAWLADHPGHKRKEHIFVADVFRWLEGLTNGVHA
ncbi:MAG: hypothetical protein Q8L97_11205 [Nitrosomonas sp.]|uniref:hypothetical protein n=1 Tax=Nitrosomonas sp. TaxID=42353 RepID=UPI0027301889|nr:hypothetical protein [Nitrosomonas sp.]MDP1550702.1 hypothetical protein [Nitrosomonas sp.]